MLHSRIPKLVIGVIRHGGVTGVPIGNAEPFICVGAHAMHETVL